MLSPATRKFVEQHYVTCRDYLYDHVKKMVKDQEAARDLVEDAFEAYLSKPRDLHTADELRALLYVICRNNVINYHKYGSGYKPKRELNIDDPHLLQQYPDIDDQLLCDELTREGIERVKKAMRLIPNQARTVIELMYFDALTTQEVGQQLGLPETLVWAAKSKGLAWLRRFFNRPLLSIAWLAGEYWY
jgi:RNA polymerase sigma-70 factor (ECF subfamily)